MPTLDFDPFESLIERKKRPVLALPGFAPGSTADLGQDDRTAAILAEHRANPAAGGDPLEAVLARLVPKQAEANPVRDAVGSFLTAGARGAAAVPREAGYDSGLGAAVGVLQGLGGHLEAERAREDKLAAPGKDLLQDLLKRRLGAQIDEPFERAKEGRAQTGRIELEGLRAKNRMAAQRAAAQQAAATKGVPQDVAQRYYAEAAAEAKALGIAEDSPVFDSMVLDRYVDRLEAHNKARGPVPGGAGGGPPKATGPVTAEDFIRGGGLKR